MTIETKIKELQFCTDDKYVSFHHYFTENGYQKLTVYFTVENGLKNADFDKNDIELIISFLKTF